MPWSPPPSPGPISAANLIPQLRAERPMVHHVTGKRRPDIAMDHVAYYSRCWATSSHGLGGTAWQSDTAASYYSSFLAPFTQHSCTRRTKRVDCNDSGSPVPDLQGPAFLQHVHAGEGSAGSAVATTQATDNGLTKIADRQPSVTLPPCTGPRTRFPRLRVRASAREEAQAKRGRRMP